MLMMLLLSSTFHIPQFVAARGGGSGRLFKQFDLLNSFCNFSDKQTLLTFDDISSAILNEVITKRTNNNNKCNLLHTLHAQHTEGSRDLLSCPMQVGVTNCCISISLLSFYA